MCKNRGIYGFLGTSWVLITCNICPPGIVGCHAKTHTRYDLFVPKNTWWYIFLSNIFCNGHAETHTLYLYVV